MSLSEHLRAPQMTDGFKKGLKTYLFKKSFNVYISFSAYISVLILVGSCFKMSLIVFFYYDTFVALWGFL